MTKSILTCPDCGKLIAARFPVHNCKPRKALLDYTDPKYLKRLVREVNGHVDGVYWMGTRCNRARLDGITFQLRACVGNWFTPTTIDIIVDAYGRNVCASRVP